MHKHTHTRRCCSLTYTQRRLNICLHNGPFCVIEKWEINARSLIKKKKQQQRQQQRGNLNAFFKCCSPLLLAAVRCMCGECVSAEKKSDDVYNP
jgi:hypothetical protein